MPDNDKTKLFVVQNYEDSNVATQEYENEYDDIYNYIDSKITASAEKITGQIKGLFKNLEQKFDEMKQKSKQVEHERFQDQSEMREEQKSEGEVNETIRREVKDQLAILREGKHSFLKRKKKRQLKRLLRDVLDYEDFDA